MNVTADKSFTVGSDTEAGEPGQPEGILERLLKFRLLLNGFW